jgi:hypothetical protein
VNDRKPWRPKLRSQPTFNSFEPPTDWTRDLGANDRVEIPDEEPEPGEAQADATEESPK